MTHDPRANQRMGIYISVAEELVPVGHHARQRASRETRQWRGRVVDLIAEDPQVPGADTAILAALELQNGKSDGIAFVSLR